MQLHPDKELFHLKSSELFWSAKNVLHKIICYCFLACIYAVMPNWCNLLTNLLLNYIINALVIQVGLRVDVHATSTVHACALSLSAARRTAHVLGRLSLGMTAGPGGLRPPDIAKCCALGSTLLPNPPLAISPCQSLL